MVSKKEKYFYLPLKAAYSYTVIAFYFPGFYNQRPRPYRRTFWGPDISVSNSNTRTFWGSEP